MGHIRLGHIPKRHPWKAVVEALHSPTTSLNEIARRTSIASQETLLKAKNIESLAHCFWLYTNIAKASREDNFLQSLSDLGIEVKEGESGFSVLKKIDAQAQIQNSIAKGNSVSSILDQIAINSFNRTILSVISDQSLSLFG